MTKNIKPAQELNDSNTSYHEDYPDSPKFSNKHVTPVEETNSKVDNANYFLTFICDDWWEGWIPIRLKENPTDG